MHQTQSNIYYKTFCLRKSTVVLNSKRFTVFIKTTIMQCLKKAADMLRPFRYLASRLEHALDGFSFVGQFFQCLVDLLARVFVDFQSLNDLV